MFQDEFHITIPSDSSMKLFPDNTTTHFMVQLPRRLTLNGRWSVALVEIEYPQTFSAIPNTEFEKNIWIYHGENQYTIEIPEFLWQDANDVVRFLQKNKEFAKHFETYLSSDNYVTLKMSRYESEPSSRNRSSEDDDNYTVHIGSKLQKILGLPFAPNNKYKTSFKGKNSIRGTLPAMLNRAIPNNLYVYTDICESCIVGDVETPLLRIVPVDIQNYVYSRTKSVNVTPPRYIPLLRTSFQTIEIDIRDHLGNPITFESGTLTVTLHFKRTS